MMTATVAAAEYPELGDVLQRHERGKARYRAEDQPGNERVRRTVVERPRQTIRLLLCGIFLRFLLVLHEKLLPVDHIGRDQRQDTADEIDDWVEAGARRRVDRCALQREDDRDPDTRRRQETAGKKAREQPLGVPGP